jgi:hypothetical protein
MNPNSTNYQHSWEPNVSDLHTAMDYLSTGEPALRVISNFQGNIIVQGDINIDTNINIVSMPPVDINSMPEVSVFTDSGNTLAIQGTVTIDNTCLAVENCLGTSLKIEGNVGLISGEDPVSPTNPLPVSLGDVCISVQNCGTDGVLNVSGAITVEGVAVTLQNPFPVDLRNTCIGVENCEGTILDVNITNTCLEIQNCGEGSLSISGNVGLLVGGQPLATGNPIPVDITDTCLKVMNCDGTRLNTNANSIILVNELPVSNLNPLIVAFPEGTCIPVTNCGDGVLSVSGNITVEGVAVTIENPFPVDLRNTCIGVQNCEGTILDVNITNTCLEIQNCGEGSLSIIGQVELTLDSAPVNISNPLPVTGTVTIDNECLSIQNCGEGSLSVNGIVQIQHGEFPVGLSNPLSVNVMNTCLGVQNCEGTVLQVTGDIVITTGDSTPISNENPLPTLLRNTCLNVQNCEGTSLEVKLTDGVNDIGFVLNDNDGQTANTWSVPVENFNMIWNGETWDRMPGNAVSGVLVNISNSCLSVANCADTVLNVAGDMNLLINGSEVSADNPVPVTFPGCISIQNCGESTLGINGTVGLQYDGQVVSDEHPLPVTGKVQALLGGTNLDAFARLRVSNPFTLFDGALRYRDDPFKWSESTSGNGLITFNTDTSTITMTSTGAGTCVRESKRVFSYQPGKSLLTMATFVMHAPTVGVRQRVGFFGAQNGVYFEANDATLYMVIRKHTGGSVDDSSEKVSQANWNGDRLNGTGPSGITLNVSKAQIWWCDIEWLGVGSVRCGFIIGGEFIVCHTFHHANLLALVYMTTATLPVRYELTVVGEGSATMQAICSTVISEGGYVNRSLPRAVGTSLTGKNLSNTAYVPLVCIRLKSTNLDAVVVPTKFEVYGLQQAAFAYRIILNPTLTNDSWNSAGTDSSVEYDIAATALAGGTVIDQGVFVGSNKGGSATITSTEVDFSQQLGRTLAGVSDIWCLAAEATTNNDDAIGVVSWQEHA